MRRLALLIVAIWATRLPLCVLAESSGHPSQHRAAEAHADHEHPVGPRSDPSGPPDPGAGCVEQCTQLAQVLPGHAPGIDIAPPALVSTILEWHTGDLLASSHLTDNAVRDRTPPDPRLRTTVLRL